MQEYDGDSQLSVVLIKSGFARAIDYKLNMSQECGDVAAKKGNANLGCINQNLISKSQEATLHFIVLL